MSPEELDEKESLGGRLLSDFTSKRCLHGSHVSP